MRLIILPGMSVAHSAWKYIVINAMCKSVRSNVVVNAQIIMWNERILKPWKHYRYVFPTSSWRNRPLRWYLTVLQFGRANKEWHSIFKVK